MPYTGTGEVLVTMALPVTLEDAAAHLRITLGNDAVLTLGLTGSRLYGRSNYSGSTTTIVEITRSEDYTNDLNINQLGVTGYNGIKSVEWN